MKIAAIYDIHGNLPALEAVLKEIEQAQPDRILVGGDIVSGPMPKETLERLKVSLSYNLFMTELAIRLTISNVRAMMH